MTRALDIAFFVPGKAIPKGNHAAFPIARGECKECKPGAPCRRRNCFRGLLVGAVITDDKGDELVAWQEFVKAHAISARNGAACRQVAKPSAVELMIAFVLPRPAAHYNKHGLSPDGLRSPLPSTKPDFDKLTRAVADAMPGALCEDDSQVAVASIAKVWADRDGKTGVVVLAREVSRPPKWVDHALTAAGIPALYSAQGALL